MLGVLAHLTVPQQDKICHRSGIVEVAASSKCMCCDLDPVSMDCLRKMTAPIHGKSPLTQGVSHVVDEVGSCQLNKNDRFISLALGAAPGFPTNSLRRSHQLNVTMLNPGELRSTMTPP